MADSPNKNSDGVIRISIFSEGNPVNTTLFALISLSIRKEVNRIGRATLIFDAGNMPENEIPESDDQSFAPGKKIRVEAGYENDENSIFEGMVINHQLVIAAGNESSLQITCCDYTFPATEVRKNKVFEKQKDSDIIGEIWQNYPGLTVSVDTTTTRYEELVQYYCTDWDFIVSRAEANGLIVRTGGREISVKKLDLKASLKLKVTYGTDLISFHGELTAEAQPISAWACAWDMSKQELISATGATPALNNQGKDSVSDLAEAAGNNSLICQTIGTENIHSLQAWVDAQVVRAGLSRIQGHCRFTDNHKVQPGDLIELDGLGSRFNEIAFTGWVEHEIKQGDWTTTAGLGLPVTTLTQKPDVMTPAASGLLPGIRGIHIGKVSKLEDDPAKENRIQVELPLLNGQQNKVWARLGTCWASNSYGTFFIPDIGDEVILGFFNEDPCYPVILGSLYSSKQPPPYDLTKENTIRSIFTKTQMKIEFDEKDKNITIRTPGENTILISDKDKSILLEDQHKNKIRMDQNGIRIDSTGNMTLKAKKNITLEAGAGIRQAAQSDIECTGMNIEAKATAALTIKGNTKAEVSAAGQTIIKGATVMIN